MSGYLLKFKQQYSVKIGGRRYPVVKIGNQLWMAENLDWKWNGLIVGSSYVNDGNPHAWYYNNDESTYGENGNKYGLLYNGYALNKLISNDIDGIPEGWHIPSYNEYDILLNTVGDDACTKLKSKTGWNDNKNGTDDYGFCAYPCGNIIADGNNNRSDYVGEQIIICSTYNSSNKHGGLGIEKTSITNWEFAFSAPNAASIRLVKTIE